MEQEEVNKMKMCRLCGFIDESKMQMQGIYEKGEKIGEYNLDVFYHKEKGMHKIGNNTWAPLPKHPRYELHRTWMKLLYGSALQRR